MILHFFLVKAEHNEYYEWGIEGDKDKALEFLNSISNDVRYKGEQKVSPRGLPGRPLGNRKYAEDVVCRICTFKYRLGTSRKAHECTG